MFRAVKISWVERITKATTCSVLRLLLRLMWSNGAQEPTKSQQSINSRPRRSQQRRKAPSIDQLAAPWFLTTSKDNLANNFRPWAHKSCWQIDKARTTEARKGPTVLLEQDLKSECCPELNSKAPESLMEAEIQHQRPSPSPSREKEEMAHIKGESQQRSHRATSHLWVYEEELQLWLEPVAVEPGKDTKDTPVWAMRRSWEQELKGKAEMSQCNLRRRISKAWSKSRPWKDRQLENLST